MPSDARQGAVITGISNSAICIKPGITAVTIGAITGTICRSAGRMDGTA
jgi:hypothetical protein